MTLPSGSLTECVLHPKWFVSATERPRSPLRFLVPTVPSTPSPSTPLFLSATSVPPTPSPPPLSPARSAPPRTFLPTRSLSLRTPSTSHRKRPSPALRPALLAAVRAAAQDLPAVREAASPAGSRALGRAVCRAGSRAGDRTVCRAGSRGITARRRGTARART